MTCDEGPYLGDVVADIVDDLHVQVIGGAVEHLGEGLTNQVGDGATVDEGEVGTCSHGLEVVLTLLGGDGGAGKLTRG